MTERFVLKELPDYCWSVSWPGYEYVVVNNPAKASNLLKILFEEVQVQEVMLGVHEYNKPDKFEIMHLDWIGWQQNPDAAARYVVDHHIVTGCKFVHEDEARKFKLIMEQRLAWKRLGGAWK